MNFLGRPDRHSSDMTLTVKPSPDSGPEAKSMAPAPPPLPYSLYEHKRGIAMSLAMIFTISCLVPVIIYYSLHYRTNLKETYVFVVITTVPIASLLTYCWRTWKLLRRSDEFRPINGATRWALDTFHWNYSLGIVVIAIFFALGSAIKPPSLALIGLPLPYLITSIGAQLLLASALTAAGVRTPIRFSSIARGTTFRPAAYIIIEDVVAVDGNGGKTFRQAFDTRYQASPLFRQLILEVSVFWGVMLTVLGVVLIVLLAEINDEIAYGLAWTLPWLFCAIWGLTTIRWVRARLRTEQQAWAATHVAA